MLLQILKSFISIVFHQLRIREACKLGAVIDLCKIPFYPHAT